MIETIVIVYKLLPYIGVLVLGFGGGYWWRWKIISMSVRDSKMEVKI